MVDAVIGGGPAGLTGAYELQKLSDEHRLIVMDRLIIRGGNTLKGDIPISGAKNAALPIIISALLAKGKHKFFNVPKLHDVQTTIDCRHDDFCITLLVVHFFRRFAVGPGIHRNQAGNEDAISAF